MWQASWLRSVQMRFKSVRKTIQELRTTRQPVVIHERDLSENFVKGSGPGGQAVNKRSNAVWLRHEPTGIQIKCHKTRSLELNRHEARKLLVRELDEQINGPASLTAIKSLRLQERARMSRKRTKAKYGTSGKGTCEPASDDASTKDSDNKPSH